MAVMARGRHIGFVALAIAAPAIAGGPVDPGLTISWVVNGAEPMTLESGGTYNELMGWWSYTGFAASDDGSLTMNYNINGAPGSPGSIGGAGLGIAFLIAGNITFSNVSSEATTTSATVTLPVANAADGTVMQGSLALGVTNEGAGGDIQALMDAALWAGLVDGVVAATLFEHPFECCAICTCGGNFGADGLEPAPPVTSSTGLRTEFLFFPDQLVSITSVFLVATLLGDLDHDRTVGIIDLLQLLAAWGPCDDPEACPADLDDDGSVGVSDFTLLLSNWGTI